MHRPLPRRGFKAAFFAIGLAFGFACAPLSARAAEPESPDAEAVQISADRMEYVGEGQYLVAVGNVKIVRDGETLQADFVQVNTTTQEFNARGRVLLIRKDGTQWEGEQLTYNPKLGSVELGKFHLQSGPFNVYADRSENLATNHLRVVHPVVTPCKEEDRKEFQIKAGSAEILDRRYVTLRHAVLWIGPVPLLYSPWWRKDLQSEGRLDSTPGYSSTLGAFQLTSYHAPLNENGSVRSATHVNLYSRRGVGLGQDLTWKEPGTSSHGAFQTFYIRDEKPYRDAKERADREAFLTDPYRYRIRLQHTGAFSPQDDLWLDMGLLSDPWVTKDFIRTEYRDFPQPDNRLTLTHRGDGYVASIALQPRWNDFYETVTRLPEVRLDSPLTELGASGVYYESRSSAGRLERQFKSNDPRDDYSTFRLDTRHSLYMPRRLFGFLNLTPRAIYEATSYSSSLSEERRRTVQTATTNESGVVSYEDTEEAYREEAGARLRNVFELGFESSFKAFRVLDEGESVWGNGLRHVAEPYLLYTYRPEPNVLAEELHYFDTIDGIERKHDVRVGMRNKLQTRIGTGGPESTRAAYSIRDVVDADVFTRMRVESDPGEGAAGPTGFDIRLRPFSGWQVDFDGSYDWDLAQIEEFNSRMGVRTRSGDALSLEYRYRADSRNQIALNTSLFPDRRWSFRTYHRFDLDDGHLAEQSLQVLRRFNCIRLGLGLRHEPGYNPGESDNFRLWVDFQLLTLPGSGSYLGG